MGVQTNSIKLQLYRGSHFLLVEETGLMVQCTMGKTMTCLE